jgi:hypothetical protein
VTLGFAVCVQEKELCFSSIVAIQMSLVIRQRLGACEGCENYSVFVRFRAGTLLRNVTARGPLSLNNGFPETDIDLWYWSILCQSSILLSYSHLRVVLQAFLFRSHLQERDACLLFPIWTMMMCRYEAQYAIIHHIISVVGISCIISTSTRQVRSPVIANGDRWWLLLLKWSRNLVWTQIALKLERQIL